jgi:glucose-6-phosphate isomerase
MFVLLLSNTRVDAFSVLPGALADSYSAASRRLDDLKFASRLWARSLDVWTSDEEVRQKIANRLGWLGALAFVTPALPRLEAFAASVQAEGFTDIVLLGMGGSSLAPEVMRQILGTRPGMPRFRMLDSVDPDAVRDAMQHAATSLFVLASKSGSTIEPNVMAAEARRRLEGAGHQWGSRFIAVTDEGTELHRRATAEGFRDIFVNPSDIGGRYSVLSFFGMVPAALLGVDLDRFVAHAREMELACRAEETQNNPGLALGALMAAGALSGRDKLTLLLPERFHALGLWVEQLVAESTGKQGKGIVPIAGEAPDTTFGDDRIAVVMQVEGEPAGTIATGRAREAALPTVLLHVPDALALGAEFLRWEVATAAAGVLLDINPFDEPNVQQAKDATKALLDTYVRERRLPVPEPVAAVAGARIACSRAADEALNGETAFSFLRLLRKGDYFGLLAYLPPDEAAFEAPLQAMRAAVTTATGCATMFGYGPRYLHSTGQLHKGGANNGVFIVISAEPDPDLEIPGQPFTFGVLEMAQAIGDFQSLDRAGRRALYIQLPGRKPAVLNEVLTALTAYLP